MAHLTSTSPQTILDACLFQGVTLALVQTKEGTRIQTSRPVPPWLGDGLRRHRAAIIAHLESTKPVKTQRALTPLEERIVKGWGWLFEREQAGQTDAEYERVLSGWKQLLERYDNERAGVA